MADLSAVGPAKLGTQLDRLGSVVVDLEEADGEPDGEDLDLAKGLVNRMLAFRAWRRAGSEGSRDGFYEGYPLKTSGS